MATKNQSTQAPVSTPSPKLEKMTVEDARRIQTHADKTGTNQAFKARAMAAAAKNAQGPKKK